MMPSDVLPLCPECGHILTHMGNENWYHCGWCDKMFIITAGVIAEVQPHTSEPAPDDV
ncbi:MAG: hypothetical protein BWY25_02576 [Chloroflexi bacterium ADurb.Bin222]|nr:MAG: hypothetical protein BWY25_02576 [Chloroflexi bacterium ADurb.Bin222]